MNRLLVLIFACISFSSMGKTVKISPNHNAFNYVGRFDHTNPKKIKFAHSGNQIEFGFKGSEFKLGLSDISNGGVENKNFFNVVINGKVAQVIESSPLLKYYTVNVNSTDSFARIEVFKRTEASCAIAVFHGLKFETGSVKKITPKARRVEWVGDSFMAGYGNEFIVPNGKSPSTGFHAKYENNYEAFSAISTRALNASYSCIAISGHGVYRNFDKGEEETLPKVYPFVFPNEGDNHDYDFSFNPDLIVLKIGTNDFGAEITTPPVMADSGRFVSTYIKFLEFIIEKNPNAKIVLAVGGGVTDYYPAGFKRLTRFRTWVQRVKSEIEEKSSMSLGFFEFKPQTAPYGEDWHPTIRSQKKFANEITPYLKEFMQW